MFGLSMREVLEKNIRNACINNKGVYKEQVIELLEKYSDDLDNIAEEDFYLARMAYLNSVFDSITAGLRSADPSILVRVDMAALSPAVCGFDGLDISQGISAGATFAICYWALTGKEASIRTCQFLSHFQNAMMDEVLVELAQGYK